MPRKTRTLSSSTARVRVAPKRRAVKKAAAPKPTTKRKDKKLPPPIKGFDAMKWFGAFPELAGPTVKIQRAMRDEC